MFKISLYLFFLIIVLTITGCKKSISSGLALGHVKSLLKIPDNIQLNPTILKRVTAKDADYWLVHIEIGPENKTLVYGKIILPRFESKEFSGDCVCVSVEVLEYAYIGNITHKPLRAVRCSKNPSEEEINNLTLYFGWSI